MPTVSRDSHRQLNRTIGQRYSKLYDQADAGRDWGQEEKGTTEDEMAGWYHRLDGCEFE